MCENMGVKFELEITGSLKNVTVMTELRHYVSGNYPPKRTASSKNNNLLSGKIIDFEFVYPNQYGNLKFSTTTIGTAIAHDRSLPVNGTVVILTILP